MARFATRSFLVMVFAAVFGLGVMATTPAFATCGQWPNNCRTTQSGLPDSPVGWFVALQAALNLF